MQDGASLVFIEVKARSSGLASASYAVTPAKQRKMCATAAYFLNQKKLERACRFDVVLFAIDEKKGLDSWKWLQDVIECG